MSQTVHLQVEQKERSKFEEKQRLEEPIKININTSIYLDRIALDKLGMKMKVKLHGFKLKMFINWRVIIYCTRYFVYLFVKAIHHSDRFNK